MVDAGPQFKPRKISDAEFRRSNVFVAWSGKVGRQVQLIGPNQYDAWLLIEFGPDVALDRPEFCRHSVAALRVAPFKLYR